MGLSRKVRGSQAPKDSSLIGAVHCDGDVVRIVVVADATDRDQLAVVSCREGARSNLETLATFSMVERDRRGSSHDLVWRTNLAGDDVLHDVQFVPPQVRSFDEVVRLDAVLAGSRWGNAAAVSASGYTVGHAFRGDQCLLAVARTETLHEITLSVGADAQISTDAFGLLELVGRVRTDRLEPSAGATLALLCCSTSIAMCATNDGSVQLLHQVSLLDRMRLAKPKSHSTFVESAAQDEVEFEFAGSYSMPTGTTRARPLAELRAADVESSVYQSALLHIVDEALGLASESAPFSPDVLLVTGDAVHRHAVTAYLRTCFGTSVIVDELDAALAVRIDEPALARDVAAQQAQFAGAFAVLAAATSQSPLTFPRAEPDENAAMHAGGATGASHGMLRSVAPALTGFLLIFLLVGGGIAAARWILAARHHAAINAQLKTENERRRELSALAEEWKAAETRLAHTRALLETINGHRQRQLTPPRLLACLRQLLPSDARLTEISFGAGVVKLSGYCEMRDVGPSVALAMEQKRESFSEVTPQTNTARMKLTSSDTGEEADTSVHTFTISAKYLGGEAR